MKREATSLSKAISVAILVEFVLFALFSLSEMLFAFPKRSVGEVLLALLWPLLIFSLAMLWFNARRDLSRAAWILVLVFAALVAFLTGSQVLAAGPHRAPFFTLFCAWHAAMLCMMFTKPLMPLWRHPKPKEPEETQPEVGQVSSEAAPSAPPDEPST
jgi:hypothetical protein